MSVGGGGGGGAGAGAGQFGDTTFTKVFVGGLAWETRKEGMRAYFEQFGDILEAVVITDKNTGRSKGYGFVTFREPEAASRACIDPYPMIDGRRANCNLAYLGVNKSKTAPLPLYLQPYAHLPGGAGNMRATKSIQTAANAVVADGAGGANYLSFVVPADHGIQQGIPTYNVYAGYSPYFSDYGYPLMGYYQGQGAAYGELQQGAQQQYAVFGGGGASATAAGLTMAGPNPTGVYPYLQYGPASATAAAAGYPHQFYQYAAAAIAGGHQPQYGGAAVALSPNSVSGVTLTAPTLPAFTAQYQYSRPLIPYHIAAAADQKPGLA